MIKCITYGIGRIIPFGYVLDRREDDGSLGCTGRSALAYETSVRIGVRNFVSRDRLLLLYDFLRQRANLAGVILDLFESVKVG